MTGSLRAFLAVLGGALLAQGLASWVLDASGEASNRMPYRFAKRRNVKQKKNQVIAAVYRQFPTAGLATAQRQPQQRSEEKKQRVRHNCEYRTRLGMEAQRAAEISR